MNKSTKKSLIYSILAFITIIAGFLVLYFVADAAVESPTPVDPEAPFAALGELLSALAAFVTIIIAAIFDCVFTSLLVYMCAYFSRENAIQALEEDSENIAMLTALKNISQLEMIFAAIIGIAASILMTLGMLMIAL